MFAELKASRRDATLVLTLSDPGTGNALHPDLCSAIIETLSTAERNDEIRAMVLTGADHHFCSGFDFRRLLAGRGHEPSEEADAIDKFHACIEAIRDCPKPVIAAVEGGAENAGFALALACDLIVAGNSARFMSANVTIGMTPEGGASWFLMQALPRQLVCEILFEGKTVPAARLHQSGIVNRLAPDGSALEAALSWSDELCAQSPNAIRRIKSLINAAPANSLAAQCESEKNHFMETLHHRDAQVGIAAFIEKRPPRYK
jgi:enoyl-CoA hydratase/carnithine racemase